MPLSGRQQGDILKRKDGVQTVIGTNVGSEIATKIITKRR